MLLSQQIIKKNNKNSLNTIKQKIVLPFIINCSNKIKSTLMN